MTVPWNKLEINFAPIFKLLLAYNALLNLGTVHLMTNRVEQIKLDFSHYFGVGMNKLIVGLYGVQSC